MILNPENVPEEAIPEGWRFLEDTDLPINHTPCRLWYPSFGRFHNSTNSLGKNILWTYIVPKDDHQPPIKVNSNMEMHHALQEVFFLVQGSPDATEHDKLCNQILNIVRSFV